MSRFAIIPLDWLQHPDVGADEIAVLCALAVHADRNHTCFPSQGLLATLLGRSRPWVCRVIGKLVEIGLVKKTNQTRGDGGERSCLYRLAYPASAVAPQESSTCQHDDSASQGENSPCHQSDSITESRINKLVSPGAPTDENRTSVAVVPPEDWQPTDSDLIWAMVRYPTIDPQAVTERFVLRCRAKGYRYADLSAAWRSWLMQDESAPPHSGASRAGGSRPSASAAHTRFAAWSSVAADASSQRRAYHA